MQKLTLSEAFLKTENSKDLHKFNIEKDFKFPKVPMTEINIKMPFAFTQLNFSKNLVQMTSYKEKFAEVNLFLEKVSIINTGSYYIFKLYCKGKIISNKKVAKMFGVEPKIMQEVIHYFSVRFEDMQLILEVDTKDNVLALSEMQQAAKIVNFYETAHKILQVVAFLNTSKKDYKIVERQIKMTSESSKKIKTVSKVIYLNNKAKSLLLNNKEKRTYSEPCYAFPVRGHIRTYSNGDQVFIYNYIKNADKELFINKDYLIQ